MSPSILTMYFYCLILSFLFSAVLALFLLKAPSVFDVESSAFPSSCPASSILLTAAVEVVAASFVVYLVLGNLGRFVVAFKSVSLVGRVALAAVRALRSMHGLE